MVRAQWLEVRLRFAKALETFQSLKEMLGNTNDDDQAEGLAFNMDAIIKDCLGLIKSLPELEALFFNESQYATDAIMLSMRFEMHDHFAEEVAKLIIKIDNRIPSL